jgi:hypothetical protein
MPVINYAGNVKLFNMQLKKDIQALLAKCCYISTAYDGCHDLLFNQSENSERACFGIYLSHRGASYSVAAWYKSNHTAKWLNILKLI